MPLWYNNLMRILLIKAFRKSRTSTSVVHPLGLMYIAAVLRSKGFNQVEILDTRLHNRPYQAVAEKIEKFKPHVVGISAITVEANSLNLISDIAKKINPATLVVAGGPHPTAYPEETLSNHNIDIVVYGEGEETFSELCTKYAGGNHKEYLKINGIAYRDSDRIRMNPPREFIADLNALPFPAWELIDMKAYSKFTSMASLGHRPYMSVITSRACPFKCIYCHNIFGKKFRARSPENILQELLTLRSKYDINEFEILDDIFNLDKKRAEKFWDEVIDNFPEARFVFPNGIRADMLDEEAIRKMKRAGVIYTAVAVESANERLQKLIKKNLNLNRVRHAIECLDEYKIFTNGFFMLGFPTETREEIVNTIRFACSSELTTAQFFIVTPFQGTELAELYKESIKNFRIDFSKYEYYLGEFNLSNVNDRELFRLQRWANIKFYYNPKRLFKIWRLHPRKHELFRYITLIPNRIIWWGRGREK